MQFMMLMIPGGYGQAAPDALPDPKAVEVMMNFNEQLAKAGILLACEGLYPPSSDGARVTYAGGKPKVTDGPFAEAKEVVGGYWMIQVKSRAEAIEWATRIPAAATDTVEIRRVFESADFTPEVAAKEAAIIKEVEKAAAKKG
jgi:hypothetical protein